MEPDRISGYRTKQQLAYTTLKDAILSCTLPPGTRLAIRDTAAKLGVSETPVRGALTQLAAEGLVDVITHAGAVVAPIPSEDIEDLSAVIGALQGLAAERATARLTAGDLARLRDLLDDLDKVPETGSYVELSGLNRQFHLAIAEMSGSTVMAGLLGQLFERYDRARISWTLVPGHRERARSEHREILRALENRLSLEARALVERHFLRAGQEFVRYLAQEKREWSREIARETISAR